MKKATGLVFLLSVIAMALVFSSAVSADPDPPPNDNQCICHETQHNNKHADGSQKGVIICVDPNSISNSAHLKHGDACVFPITHPNAIAACEEATADPVTADECLGNVCTVSPESETIPEDQLEICCALPEFQSHSDCG